MGLISIVTGANDEALSKALEDLPVSEEIKNGITGGGIFSEIYHLSCAYESGKWEDVKMCAAGCGIDLEALRFEYAEAQSFVKKYGSFGN